MHCHIFFSGKFYVYLASYSVLGSMPYYGLFSNSTTPLKTKLFEIKLRLTNHVSFLVQKLCGNLLAIRYSIIIAS